MKAFLSGLAFAVLVASTTFAQRGGVDLKKPLVIASQGSFFVGGEKKALMVHGCCLSSKTWETTPDGRMGWDEYFVRRDLDRDVRLDRSAGGETIGQRAKGKGPGQRAKV